MTDEQNRGQERSAEARAAAQAKGAKAHGRGGNPDKADENEEETPDETTNV